MEPQPRDGSQRTTPCWNCEQIDALLTTAFDWKELANFLRLPAGALERNSSPQESAAKGERCQACRVLHLAHQRTHNSPAFRRRLAHFLSRRAQPMQERWVKLPLGTRRHAARTAKPQDFRERNLDPACFLWCLLQDDDSAVRKQWKSFARRSFPYLRKRLA